MQTQIAFAQAAESDSADTPKKREAAEAAAKRRQLEEKRSQNVDNVKKADSARSDSLNQKLEASQKSADKKTLDEYLAQYGQTSPKITADSPINYDANTDRLVAKNNARLYSKNFDLTADNIEFFGKTGQAHAYGDVRFSEKGLRVLAEDAKVDSQKSSFDAQEVRFGYFPIFIASDKASGDKKDIATDKAKVYYGEPDYFSLNINVDNIHYDVEDDYIEFDNALFQFGPLPFMYIPYYGQHGLKRPPFYVELGAGFNSDDGLFVQNTILYSGLGPVAFGPLIDYYGHRGLLIGPALEWEYENAYIKSEAFLRAAYIDDHASLDVLGEDSFGRALGRDRFFAEFKTKNRILDKFGLVANMSYWSDEYATRDFRDRYFYHNQHPDNFIEGMYYGGDYTVSLFTRFAPNGWEQASQRLPELRFDMSPMQLFNARIYQNAYASYGYYNEASTDLVSNSMATDRFDAYYGLSRPINFNSWSSFTPVLGGRLTYYGQTADRESYTRMLGQIGFDSEMNAWGLWQVRSKTLGLDGIRHNFKPVLKYRYIPSAEQGSGKIFAIDDTVFNTYAPVFDLGQMRNTDRIYNTNTLRVGFENVFQTRDGAYGSREFARIDLYQDFNFDKYPYEGDPTRKYSFSDLYTNISVSPARWLRFGAYNRINVNDASVSEISGYMEIRDMDAWRLVLGNIYMDSGMRINQYYALLEIRLSEKYLLRGRWNYNADLSMMTEQIYSLRTRLGNSWIIEYLIGFRSGSERENNFSAGVRVSLMAY